MVADPAIDFFEGYREPADNSDQGCAVVFCACDACALDENLGKFLRATLKIILRINLINLKLLRIANRPNRNQKQKKSTRTKICFISED
jgi:hypothetical protein